MNKLCPYRDKYRGTPLNSGGRWGFKTGVKKHVRVACPECGRRMIGWAAVCHDGCCVEYTVPPHKPKCWWKKPKAKSKDRSAKG